jgi:hypothetical protein
MQLWLCDTSQQTVGIVLYEHVTRQKNSNEMDYKHLLVPFSRKPVIKNKKYEEYFKIRILKLPPGHLAPMTPSLASPGKSFAFIAGYSKLTSFFIAC